MRDKITVYGLLSKIYNNCPNMPKRINCCGYEYEWDSDYRDYLRTDDEKDLLLSFLDNHNYNLYCFLKDTVDIIEEDKKLEKLNYEELVGVNLSEAVCNKINELIDIVNNLKQE